jgi:hypothetical protein
MMTHKLSIGDMLLLEMLGIRRSLVVASKLTSSIGGRQVYLCGMTKQATSGALTGSRWANSVRHRPDLEIGVRKR